MSIYIEESCIKTERKAQTLVFLAGGGTGFDAKTWRRIAKEFTSTAPNARHKELDCPHYVHNHEYEVIAKEITAFLNRVGGMKSRVRRVILGKKARARNYLANNG